MTKTQIVYYYHPQNRYSYHVLTAALEKNSVNAQTTYAFKDFHEQISRALTKSQKVVVGVSFGTPQVFDMIELAKNVKQKFGDKILLVAGGPHPSGDQHGTLRMGFDVVVSGEGEKTFSELVDKFNKDDDYLATKSISYLDNGKYAYTGVRKTPIQLDDYPPFDVTNNKFNPIEITRGCSFGCNFCQTTYLNKFPLRHRSVENIKENVKTLLKQNLTKIRFITPTAFAYGAENSRKTNLDKVQELLQTIRSTIGNHGKLFYGTFPSEVRPENVTPETVKLVTEYCDNDNVIIGAQSGSERMLKKSHRGHTLDTVYRATEACVEGGLVPNIDFIFGLPGETQEDMELSIKAMKELSDMGARIHGHTFMPLAGSPWQNKPPGKVSKELVNEINKLVSNGKLYGQWKQQEEIAERIYNYLH